MKHACIAISVVLSAAGVLIGQTPHRSGAGAKGEDSSAPRVLDQGQWIELNHCVDKALNWLASEQQPDGSFPTLNNGQPAVTALCMLAFLAAGREIGSGTDGDTIERALNYILESQTTSGLLSRIRPARREMPVEKAQASAYNHAIAGLALSEAYGMEPRDRDRIRQALDKAVAFALQRQPFPKRQRADEGGWRYLIPHQRSDSDLSVTSWYLMFLRSCRNAGFDIPSSIIDDGSSFVMRCFEPTSGHFWYALRGQEHVTTRGMTGAGILSLSLAGKHGTPAARAGGDWILEHPWPSYRASRGPDRFFYGSFYCSQAMFQLGGHYWRNYYPPLLRMLATHQRPDGSWDDEPGSDRVYGTAYTTALAVLALSPPYQILPIFQR